MSSVGSNSSVVSFRGNDEVDLDEALRELYSDLQSNLNSSQCTIRTLSLCEERSDTFIEAVCIYHELNDFIDVLMELFDELKDVSLQCLGPCPKEHKIEFKALVDARKEKKKKEKDDKKLMMKQLKELEKLEKIKE
jgi:hypothetical protein